VLTDASPVLEVPISALEHYSYCPRQCALIHVEQTYDENLYTIKGQLAHERVESDVESRDRGVDVLRGIPLWSEHHGLVGKSDVIELRPEGPYPVEYKSGRPHGQHAAVQLCAQALCLEEMLARHVARGAIYWAAARRRVEVEFDPSLRRRTVDIISAVRVILERQSIPPAVNDARCPKCSLIHSCLPSVVAESARLRGLQGALFRPVAAPLGENGDA
jgi:CRISPR-associated exonuclease Cas4